jgi:excisionase family DNA binding protein
MRKSRLQLLSVPEAAAYLGVTNSRVQQFCQAGRLGQPVGDRWVIRLAELERFAKIPRPVGRPPVAKRK